jgi:hypothetical protein
LVRTSLSLSLFSSRLMSVPSTEKSIHLYFYWILTIIWNQHRVNFCYIYNLPSSWKASNSECKTLRLAANE